MRLIPLTSTTDIATTGASAVAIGEKGGARLLVNSTYQFTAGTDSWIRQGTATLLTTVAKASLVDGETFTISFLASNGAVWQTFTYEFDVDGLGVKVKGNIQVNVSTDTTAATVAARMRTAILATQPALEVVDNANGTLSIAGPDLNVSYAETVANAGFTFADAIMPVTKADGGGMEVYAKAYVLLDGGNGPHVGVIQDTATSTALMTRCQVK